MFTLFILCYMCVFVVSSKRLQTICALVTGVQTCALPSPSDRRRLPPADVRHGRSVMARAATTTTRRRANGKPQVPFVHKLALNQWLLSLFDVKRSEEPSRRERVCQSV